VTNVTSGVAVGGGDCAVSPAFETIQSLPLNGWGRFWEGGCAQATPDDTAKHTARLTGFMVLAITAPIVVCPECRHSAGLGAT